MCKDICMTTCVVDMCIDGGMGDVHGHAYWHMSFGTQCVTCLHTLTIHMFHAHSWLTFVRVACPRTKRHFFRSSNSTAQTAARVMQHTSHNALHVIVTNLHLLTWSEWPVRHLSIKPVFASHSRIELSDDPAARRGAVRRGAARCSAVRCGATQRVAVRCGAAQ